MVSKRMLPWLSLEVKQEFDNFIDETIITELRKRFWGSDAVGKSAGGGRRLLITDFRGLMLAIGSIRYFMSKHETKIFYRGQVEDWELAPSLFRNCKTKEDFKKNLEWNRKIIESLSDTFDIVDETGKYREALLQHYGMRTTCFDVVDHVQTACWFACNGVPNNAYKPEDKNNKIDSDIGYFYIMAVPEKDNDQYEYIDLRQKPSEWLRPQIQQAFVIRQKNPLAFGTKLNHLCVLTFIIPTQLLKIWSNSEFVTEEIIYPHYAYDRGIKHYLAATQTLKERGFSLLPPIH